MISLILNLDNYNKTIWCFFNQNCLSNYFPKLSKKRTILWNGHHGLTRNLSCHFIFFIESRNQLCSNKVLASVKKRSWKNVLLLSLTGCGSPAFLDNIKSLNTSEKFASFSSTLANATPNVVKDCWKMTKTPVTIQYFVYHDYSYNAAKVNSSTTGWIFTTLVSVSVCKNKIPFWLRAVTFDWTETDKLIQSCMKEYHWNWDVNPLTPVLPVTTHVKNHFNSLCCLYPTEKKAHGDNAFTTLPGDFLFSYCSIVLDDK